MQHTIVQADLQASHLMACFAIEDVIGHKLTDFCIGDPDAFDELGAKEVCVTVDTLTLPMQIVLKPMRVDSRSVQLQLRAESNEALDPRDPAEVLNGLARHLGPPTLTALEAVGFAGLTDFAGASAPLWPTEEPLPGGSLEVSIPRAVSISAPLDKTTSNAHCYAGNLMRLQSSRRLSPSMMGPSSTIGRRLSRMSITSHQTNTARQGALTKQSTAAASVKQGTTVDLTRSSDGEQADEDASDSNDSSQVRAVDPAEHAHIFSWLGDSPDPQPVAAKDDEEGHTDVENKIEQESQATQSVRRVDPTTERLVNGLSDAAALESGELQKSGAGGSRTAQIAALLAKAKVYQGSRKLVWLLTTVSLVTLVVLIGGFTGFVVLVSITRSNVEAILHFEQALVAEAKMMAETRSLIWQAHLVTMQARQDVLAEMQNAAGGNSTSVDIASAASLSGFIVGNETFHSARLKNDTQCISLATRIMAEAQNFKDSHRGVYMLAKKEEYLSTNLLGQLTRPTLHLIPETRAQAEREALVPSHFLDEMYSNASTWQELRTTMYSVWDVGNTLATLCSTIATDYARLELIQEGGIETTVESQIIMSTGPVILPTAYLELMRTYIRDTNKNAVIIFKLSMMILAVEIGSCLMASILVCSELWHFFTRRRLLFTVFLHIPKAVIRALAHRKVKVEAIGEQEENANEEEVNSIETGSSSMGSAKGGKEGVSRSQLDAGDFGPPAGQADGEFPNIHVEAQSRGIGEAVESNTDGGFNMDLPVGVRGSVLREYRRSSFEQRSRVKFASLGSGHKSPSSLMQVPGSEKPAGRPKSPDSSGHGSHGTLLSETSFTHSNDGSDVLGRPKRSRKVLYQQRWAVLRGGWVFCVILVILSVIHSNVSFKLYQVGEKLFTLGVLSYLNATVAQVRFTAIALVHCLTYARRMRLREALLSKVQYMRFISAVLINGRGVARLLPADLLAVYQSVAAFQTDVEEFAVGLESENGPDVMMQAPPGGCWRTQQWTCLSSNDTLYPYTTLAPTEMVLHLWSFVLDLVAIVDDEKERFVQSIGFPEPELVNGSIPLSYFTALDATRDIFTETAVVQSVLRTEQTSAYRFVTELARADLHDALEHVLRVRFDALMGVCKMATAAHCVGMVVTVLLFIYYWRHATSRITSAAKTVTFRVANVLSLMPKHVKVLELIDKVLEQEKHKKRHKGVSGRQVFLSRHSSGE